MAPQFLQTTIRYCRFDGTLEHVLFDGRELAGKPKPGGLTHVDFSRTTMRNVEFRGCRLSDVVLPDGVYALPRFPQVAQRVLEWLAGEDSMEARMLRADMEATLQLPGSDDSVGVFIRSDYLASGGQALADLAETMFLRAAREGSG